MEYRAILTGLILTLLLALTACGGGDSGPKYDPSCPLCEPEDFEDHVLMSCPIYYRWNGWPIRGRLVTKTGPWWRINPCSLVFGIV